MMGVLIDTSVWIDHFRHGNDGLAEIIGLDLAMTHPMVIVEIACGTPPAPRAQTLHDISLLQQCHQASLTEVMEFIEREKLYGLGCGLVDIVLLASTLMTRNYGRLISGSLNWPENSAWSTIQPATRHFC